jgi:hypothetical protein
MILTSYLLFFFHFALFPCVSRYGHVSGILTPPSQISSNVLGTSTTNPHPPGHSSHAKYSVSIFTPHLRVSPQPGRYSFLDHRGFLGSFPSSRIRLSLEYHMGLHHTDNKYIDSSYTSFDVVHLITCISNSPSRLFSVGTSSFISSNTLPSSSPVAGSIPSSTASHSRNGHVTNCSKE